MLQNELHNRLMLCSKKQDGDVYIGIVDKLHEMVHRGNCFTANLLLKGVANNEFARLLVSLDGTKQMHVVIEADSEGKAYFKTYTGGTYVGGTGADANLTSFNRCQTCSQVSSATLVYNPTVNVAGTLRGNRIIVGGTGGIATGGSTGSRIESVIKTGQFMVEVQNVSGQARDMSIILDWYEED